TQMICLPVGEVASNIRYTSLVQGIDQACLSSLDDLAIPMFEVVQQFSIVFEPPKGRLREDQKLCSAPTKCLQQKNRLSTIGGVVTGVLTALGLGEVPCAPTAKAQQLFISLADNQHRCVHRQAVLHNLADFLDKAL